MKVISVVVLSMVAFGCGYGSNYHSTPAMGAGPSALSGLVPNAAPAGGAGFTLTVNGSNFASAVVYFNGAPETTTYVTTNQLTAAIPGSAIAAAGTKAVYVNSGGQNSPSMNFTVN